MKPPVIALDALAEAIPDGARIAVAKDPEAPIALARALIARGARDLHLVTMPTSGVFADALIGGGCVKTIETSGVSLGEHGPAPFFAEAVKTGGVEIRDATCPAVYSAIQAGEKGIPFIPIRGIIGSDLLKARKDWKVVPNPFAAEGEEDPIVLLPAIVPDVALLHVSEADRFGNAWVQNRHELKMLAHAAKRTLVTAERIVDGNLADDPAKTANLVSAIYIEAMAEAPGGAWPLACPPDYGPDAEAQRAYAASARAAVKARRDGAASDDWILALTPRAREAAE